MTTVLTTSLIERTKRVPLADVTEGDGEVIARQLDAALATAGFTCSTALLTDIARTNPADAFDRALAVMNAARRLVGDHVQHNAYFVDFPKNVPDTIEFWAQCLRDAVMAHAENGGPTVAVYPTLNLLDLPTYGRYQHSFADLVAAHDELARAAGDRITVLHLGGTFDEEVTALLSELGRSTVPLTAGDLALLQDLAFTAHEVELSATDVPVRENRAVIDHGRMLAGKTPVLATSVTDVLRLAAAMSQADVTLVSNPRFRSFTRSERRLLLSTIDKAAERLNALAEVLPRREMWKRLGERLHPHEHGQWVRAQAVFEVARGERHVESPIAMAERLASTDPGKAATALRSTPGTLIRWADRLLRSTVDEAGRQGVLTALRAAAPSASARVLLSLREHVENRLTPDRRRIFANRTGRGHVAEDTRPTLTADVVAAVKDIIDQEIAFRIPRIERLMLDPAVLSVALPLSGKATVDGLATVPRGTQMALPTGDTLRFFNYWRETERRTDFDLSLLMLDSDFKHRGHVSWTGLRSIGAVHSGDITESRHGATEFIDVSLNRNDGVGYLIPQVNIYTGEGFDEVSESLFGFMMRDQAQKGMPFEPRTVRYRSEMRGAGRVALPAVFHQSPDGAWLVTWLHLTLSGSPSFNMVETNRVSTTELARAIVERKYLTVAYLVEMLIKNAGWVQTLGTPPAEPVTYIGLERPDGLAEGSEVVTLDNLSRLIPA